MELEFHPEAWPQLLSTRLPGTDRLMPLDWHGLRAQLVAAHALRCEILRAQQIPNQPCSSFGKNAADQLAALCDASPLVNPGNPVVNLSVSANCKPLSGIEVSIGGAFTPGERGL